MQQIIEPIRVLHMIGSLNIGGSQTLVMNLYKKIDRNKIQFDFIIDQPNDLYFASQVEELGGKIYVFPKFNGKNFFEIKRAWKNFFNNHREYKILHSHVRSYASLYIPVAKKYGLKTIIHSHSTSNGKGISSILKDILQYPLRYQADYFFGCSKDANEWLFGRRIAQNELKCKIIKNGIDISNYKYNLAIRKKYREKLNIQDKLVIGTVGRIVAEKNPLFTAEIIFECIKKNPNAVFLWVGDGSLMTDVHKRIKDLDIEKSFIMVGSQSNVAEYLQAMDIFLFPSVYEGLGISLIEAQANGLPCICSDSIPEEAHVTNLMNKVSLNENAIVWADIVLNTSIERKDYQQQIVDVGYDISYTAKWIQKFYFDIINY